MNADLAALLDHLCDLGIVVTADGDRLKVDAPAGALTDDLRAPLVERKAEILDYLSRRRWYIDPDAPPLRIPLSIDKPPSEWLSERGMSIAGGTWNGPNGEPTLFLVDCG